MIRYKYIIKILKVLIGLLWINLGYCQNNLHYIQKFIEQNFNNSHVGLIILDLDNNKTVYQHNPHKLFIPASLLKFFTLATSLVELKADFKFTTSIKLDHKKIKNHQLNNDVAIVFTGDPSLQHKDLEQLIINTKKQGINNINGNLIIDDTFFSDKYASGWINEDLAWHYAAPSGGIIIAENKIPITILPITTIGQTAQFIIEDQNKLLFPIHTYSTVKAVTEKESNFDCKLEINTNSNNDLAFSGCLPINNNIQKINVALNNPRQYLKDVLGIYLKNHAIKLNGDIIFTKAPTNLKIVANHNSKPLIDLLKVMMIHSNNTYAHAIGKALGAKLYQEGSFKTATKAILHILQKRFTVNTSTLRITDSSGLSFYNAITPEHVARLLRAINHDQHLKKQINDILSISGKTGTLKNRLTAKDLTGKMLAKTGTLSNASGLAGYLTTKKNKKLGLVFIVNNTINTNFNTKQLEDELCELLINFS